MANKINVLDQILFATSNQDKQKELLELFSGLVKCIFPDKSAYPSLVINECGDDYHINAFIKARTYARCYQLPSLADDSGVELLDLAGWPGPATARWSNLAQKDKNSLIIEKLRRLPDATWEARFVSVLALYHPLLDQAWFVSSYISGKIVEPRGDNGFGYDPIFQPHGSKLTYGEMAGQKNTYSHRAIASKKMIEIIKNLRQTNFGS